MANNKSIEEQVEDIAKNWLKDLNIKYHTKTDSINSEIEEALKKAPSKAGGKGNNYPDIKLLLQTKTGRKIPVMIEVKGKQNDLEKLDEDNFVSNQDKAGQPNYANIQRYAVNGAVHYSSAILNYTNTYDEVIAIGITGWQENKEIKTELKAYYLSGKNLGIAKLIDNYTDFGFLTQKNLDELADKIDSINLTEEEKEKQTTNLENQIEINLKSLNQEMQDVHSISEDYRVKLISGLIMAGLGVEKDGKCIVAPLELSDLKGEAGAKTHDGMVILNKIESFLAEKKLPEQKREMIKEVLGLVFIYSKLYEVENDESKLKKVYKKVKDEILPFFNPKYHIDFTGRLFNVLNAWVKVPDGSQNDVVLTPRYVCELMTKLCQVNENSYVWDYATGSAGFLISAMKEMIKKANTIADPNIRNQKIMKIKAEQLLGVEKLPDIYMLAVLNMILMGDGSSNIIHKNSLTEFKGIYEMGEHNGEPFPADVFLLNPPYSAEGKGFVFVEKALNRMEKGRAAVLIQENAGSGNGLPYTKRILKNNTLLASIHMSDIFCGKAGVQTAIYVFDVGNPHNENKLVKFIDFSNDGYTRQNRKKSSANVNLKNTDHADERYKEIVDIVLGNKKDTHYFDNYVIEDTITLNGDDWTYNQHRKIDTTPTEQDFKKTVADYLSWKVSTILKEETGENF